MGPSASWELLAKNAPGHPAAFVDPRVSASLMSALRGQPREAQIDAGEVGLSSALSGRSPLLHPVAIRMPDSPAGDRWKDVSGGGCGFAIAISGIGRYFYYFPSACAFCPFRFGFGLLLSERQRP
ncbi:hypothetical protein B296_00015810 [Ensete ventricosum]|uniref:Uncharacterized protein n=1 Tax=Ensete ventricosum TaxID=4639 RepID=A0A426YC63_ENSVE|nr:hypothetical protein B296_00015810 [Ensete ventricosum]